MVPSNKKFPSIINLNVFSGDCPCKCSHCPVGVIETSERKKKFQRGEMQPEVFSTVLDAIQPFVKEGLLRIHSVGEPLLWKMLSKSLKLASEKKVKCWLFTSAALEEPDLIDDISLHCNIVEVSINSISRADYLLTKGVDKFQLVIDNIERMRRNIDNEGVKTRLIVSRVQSDNPIRDNEFIDYWKASRLVDDAFIRSFHDYNGLISGKNNAANIPCLVHWSRMNIDFNGDVYVCFNELFKKEKKKSLKLGNVLYNPIIEIWNGKYLNEIREANYSGDYTLYKHTKNLPCKKCHYCQPLDGKNQTSEYQMKKIDLQC
jgi:pyruvate-formate lyase-activating enzyme